MAFYVTSASLVEKAAGRRAEQPLLRVRRVKGVLAGQALGVDAVHGPWRDRRRRWWSEGRRWSHGDVVPADANSSRLLTLVEKKTVASNKHLKKEKGLILNRDLFKQEKITRLGSEEIRDNFICISSQNKSHIS